MEVMYGLARMPLIELFCPASIEEPDRCRMLFGFRDAAGGKVERIDVPTPRARSLESFEP